MSEEVFLKAFFNSYSKKKKKHIYSENRYLLNTHISYDKLLLTRKLLDLRLI